MKRKAKIKDTGEVVEVVSSNLGRCRVRYIRRDKVETRGKLAYETGSVRMANLEIL